jgi:hypothetical protein
VKMFGVGDRDQIRADFLQYMTDCLVVLVETVTATGSSRTIRIAKYRGSGCQPVPLVIEVSGIDVVAFKGARLGYPTFIVPPTLIGSNETKRFVLMKRPCGPGLT